MTLSLDRRGVQLDSKNIDNTRIMIQFKYPLNEIAVDFYDALKSVSSGYASFDYEEYGYESSDIVKVTTLWRHVVRVSNVVELLETLGRFFMWTWLSTVSDISVSRIPRLLVNLNFDSRELV